MTTRKFPLILLLMMEIVSAGSLIQLQPASATFPGKNGKIVFTRNIAFSAVQYEIFTVNPDGSGLTQLTFTAVGVRNTEPRWSADGTRIVFQRSGSGQSAIWVMNADGSGQTQVTHPTAGISNFHPAFSPDGSKIVFVNDSSGISDIWLTNIDGTIQKALTTGPEDDEPVWSPDGSKITFVKNAGQIMSGIVVMNADGSAQTEISNPSNAVDNDPEWSPDGRMITFHSAPSQAIWVMNADGSGRKQLSTPDGSHEDLEPAWSPDGTKIAFARLEGGSIWVMNSADGSNPVDITHLQTRSETDEDPNWQPLFANPVGGIVTPTNKLEIITPYLALAGLVVAVSAVVAVKRRRD